MPNVVGMATTFNTPNFVGELYTIGKVDTPFLSAIGGLTGGKVVYSKGFEWQDVDLRAASSHRQRLEGAPAPTAQERARYNERNVVEIHHETVSVSWTRLADIMGHSALSLVGGNNPIQDEEAFQIKIALLQIARDVEDSLINSTFAEPADNLTPRRTRGLLDAITTNIWDAHGQPLTAGMVLGLAQMAWENGGLRDTETRTLMGGISAIRRVVDLFVPQNAVIQNRMVGGVNLQTIESPMGNFNLMADQMVPTGTLAAADLSQCSPCHLLIPERPNRPGGFMFITPLGLSGSSDDSQIYGEVGLEYGQESRHGKIVDFTTQYDSITGSGS